jgi:hypothetical protein
VRVRASLDEIALTYSRVEKRRECALPALFLGVLPHRRRPAVGRGLDECHGQGQPAERMVSARRYPYSATGRAGRRARERTGA